MQQKFQELKEIKTNFQESYNLLEKIFDKLNGEKVAIAVSGGSDSIFLSYLILSYRKDKKLNTNNIYFFHCNHKIRKESEVEAKYLKDFFKDYNFKLFIRENTKEEKEEILRKRRYNEFNNYCKTNKIKYIFLGHNLTDKIETTLMNTIRGCGLKGFLNMEFLNKHPLLDENIFVIRPLLSIPKSEIEKFCTKNNIKFFEDKTNFDTIISLRNKLRHDFIIPLSKLGKQNSFFQSWNTIYNALNNNQNQNCLLPIPLCPYRNAKNAYKRAITKNMINIESVVSTLENLGIQIKKGEINQLLTRLKHDGEGFQKIGTRTVFNSHSQTYFIESIKPFWKKELNLEKQIKNSGIQCFGKYKIDVPEELVGSTIRFPKLGDHYKNKLLTKRAINEKIPIFWRNILPLAEKDKKIIFVFEPNSLIY